MDIRAFGFYVTNISYAYICTDANLQLAARRYIASLSLATKDLRGKIYVVRDRDETKETPRDERKTRIPRYHGFPLCSYEEHRK